MTTTDARHHKGRKRVNLALQGGGSHGAFTWGVLERLICDGRIFIDGLSGTSAGAMNAVVFTDGFVRGRQKRAVDALRTFWTRVCDGALVPTALSKAMAPLNRAWDADGDAGFQMVDAITRIFSPYQLNPLDIHPLRGILSDLVDFDGLRRQTGIKLFVAATNVRTCKLKVFRTPELTVDTLLASACLPMLFRAVEINGESYWDGGYLANPAISPLINDCISKDVIIVQVNPMNRHKVPNTAREILNRVNEISFNSSLVREMIGISTVTRLLEQGKAEGTGYAPVHFHMIEAEADIGELGAASKFNADWAFLSHLHELGMKTADRWLAEHFDSIGNASTLDMIKAYRERMTVAYWMVLAAALVPYVGTAYAKFSAGGFRTYDNRAPRAAMESLPPARRRAYWAQLNGFEAFAPFAAGVIVAHLAGASQQWIDALAVAFVALRLAYTLLYIYDRPTGRSLVWAAALACVVGLFVAAASR